MSCSYVYGKQFSAADCGGYPAALSFAFLLILSGIAAAVSVVAFGVCLLSVRLCLAVLAVVPAAAVLLARTSSPLFRKR